MPTDNYAAYVDTPDGAVPIKDLSAQEQLQKKAPAIIETASGESILLTDSGEQALQGLNLYGKSTQESTTGAQLFDYNEWIGIPIVKGTGQFIDNGVVLTATDNDCYTAYDKGLPGSQISVTPGNLYTLSWEHSGAAGEVYVFQRMGILLL